MHNYDDSFMLIRKIGRRFRKYYRHFFCHQNYIYKHDGPYEIKERTDSSFEFYDDYDDIPENVIADISANNNQRRLATDKLELTENATLWVAFVNGHVATTVFTRKGEHCRRWFVSLQPDDVIIFRLHTRPQFRGRGLAPSLIHHAAHSSTSAFGNVFIDCRTYNKPSIRCIEKAGFKCIATMKTIKREWVLYD